MDLDVALREEEPDVPEEDDSTKIKNKYEKWHKANRMAILIMKRSMYDTVRGGIADTDSAKEFLASIEAKFKESDKAETGNLMNSLMTTKYVDGSVREHIVGLIDIATKLNGLDVAISDPFLVHVALNSLPSEYSQLKSTYNAQKEKWDLNELIAICVHEEQNIRQEKNKVANLVHTHAKNSVKENPKNPAYKAKGSNNFKAATKPNGLKCFFCKKFVGHLKKDCPKYRRWLEKQKAKGVHKQEGAKQG